MSDDAICGQEAQDSLFSNFFVQNTECISGRDGSILDTINDQIGTYLYEDEDGIGICRAGSASVGLSCRHNEHVIASKQKETTSIWSHFYACYPDKGDAEQIKGIKGTF